MNGTKLAVQKCAIICLLVLQAFGFVIIANDKMILWDTKSYTDRSIAVELHCFWISVVAIFTVYMYWRFDEHNAALNARRDSPLYVDPVVLRWLQIFGLAVISIAIVVVR
ncbi:hypothetical protein DY251_09650 [Mesorhizobium denitrificans]|uniref:Uncharacterized protein n=1 Tax=Mesorhizobium denitrificans TaxID=2294114 RepID=A0A371XF33_9HYPH|nr:hypothetical protein DY251_09650 [Mesorhizobium denitrificans]